MNPHLPPGSIEVVPPGGTVDFGVLIGRFQPFHNGHLHLVREALDKCGRLMILVGSSNRPRLTRNPFTYEERAAMISAAIHEGLGPAALDRTDIEPIPDRLYDYPSWLSEVQHVMTRVAGDAVVPSTGLFGHTRDHTSYYLNDFPSWRSLVAAEAGAGGIEATHIRRRYFRLFEPGESPETMRDYLTGVTPGAVAEALMRFRGDEAFTEVLEDLKAVETYQRDYGDGPHSTGDAVVLCAGSILLVKRSKRPLMGTWATPGGFLNRPDKSRGEAPETLYQCATRELAEETLIDFNTSSRREREAILRNAYKGRDIFDEPTRDDRARIITTAHLFDLGGVTPPKITAGDDAAAAIWAPLTTIRARTMYSDHAFIIPKMLKLIERGNIH